MSQPVLSLPRRRPPAVLRLVPSGRALLVATAVVIAAGGLYGLARETSMFAIESVEVRGGSSAIDAQARRVVESVIGTSLLRLDGAKLVRRLEELPGVRIASYDRAFPHTLRVSIVPEDPVALLREGGLSWLVSGDGRVIAAADRTAYRSLPRMWLPLTADISVGTVIDDATVGTAVRALATVQPAGFAHRIAWAAASEGQLRFGLRGGLEVRFGDPSDLELKLAIVKSILPTLAPVSAGGPAYLDVSVPERPVAGLNSQPSTRR